MMTMAALIIAIASLCVTGLGIAIGAVLRRRTDRKYEALAQRIDIDSRLEYLTVQTLGAMRDTTRQYQRRTGGSDDFVV
ncbi:hypothetical protein [Acidithrix sp. C25]|uniref:hypothetical protein n=1 Tax=Acidithrix sp. C25 TaxID=1671482 RepID=UPI00191BBA03|nr:hypothetical protein [Acidithrix sp. C25]CAG4900034.1 unnamed protein product [Acidithrix sp. C25]